MKQRSKKLLGFNEDIALEVLTILNRFWREQIGIFKFTALPQYRISLTAEWRTLSERDRANFLFFVSMPQRGARDTDIIFEFLWETMKFYPELFDPIKISKKLSPQKIENIFRAIATKREDNSSFGVLGLKLAEHKVDWCKNSAILVENWGGDIRNLFHGKKNFESVFEKINDIEEFRLRGIYRKVFALVNHFLVEQNLIQNMPAPIPVDFHAMRILCQTNMLDLTLWEKPFNPTKPKHPQDLRGKPSIRIWYRFPDQIAHWSQEFLQQHGLSNVDTTSALWVLGRTLCSMHPQAGSKDAGKIYLTSEKLDGNPGLWKPHSCPCDFCPIEKYCKWVIPSNPYSVFGCLIKIRRVESGIDRFPQIDWPEMGEIFKARRTDRRNHLGDATKNHSIKPDALDVSEQKSLFKGDE